MIDPHEIPKAVLWHEGMLLAPQHFQEAAHRAEALLAYRLAAACPYPWGVARLGVDRAALADGLFRVDELEAVLPDGMLVLHPRAGAAAALELDLKAAGQDLRATAAPRVVHLAVAARGGDVGGAGEGQLRFRSVEGAACADEATGEDPIEIPRLVPAPVLLLGDEHGRAPSRRWASLPLARVAFRDDLFVLDRCCGPRLRVERDSELHAVAGEVAVLLREKAVALAERLQGPGADRTPGAAGWEAVQALARGLPRLDALLAGGSAHPFDVFLALADIVGDLTGVARQSCPPQLRPYAHHDPLPAFVQAAELIAGAAGRLREPYRTIRFRRAGDGRFTLELPAGLAGRELVLGARGGPGAAPAAVAGWLEAALIGSASQLRAIRERRTLGAPRAVVDGITELDLLAPRGTVLARVGPDPVAIRAGEPLEVVGPGTDAAGAEPVEVVLFLGITDAEGAG